MSSTNKTQIWVDADACPVVIKEILFKAANRTQIQITLIANHALHLPPSRYLNFIQVHSGFDVADNEIVKRLNVNDLVITSDIPLADEVISKGGLALSPRGELFNAGNIKSKLSMRDFMDVIRSSGVQTGGPAPLNQADRQTFAKHLDHWLNRHKS
ncbi:YaiI/YqxD family protein [Candidatus Thioglobus sp.]|uniref:YaiI/YqxD family protein n=1 Tax=Candidatus Thioglobus sp. TaxID=2026721 RepID=UPI003D0CF260